MVGGLCERCAAEGIVNPGYIVHHKIYLTEDNYKEPSIAFNFENLEYLCQYHHNNEHKTNRKNKRYIIDDSGVVTILDDGA